MTVKRRLYLFARGLDELTSEKSAVLGYATRQTDEMQITQFTFNSFK